MKQLPYVYLTYIRIKKQECIIFILLQSIYTPVVDIHVFTQLGHFCYFIDTIGSLLKKGFDCSRLSILHWILKQILYSLSNTNHNITCLTLLRLGGGGGAHLVLEQGCVTHQL